MLKLEKSYFTLAEVQARWKASVADMHYFIVTGELEVRAWVMNIEAMNVEGPEPMVLNDLHALYADELWAVLRSGASPIKRFRINGVELHRTDLTPPFIVREDDLMVTREERDRFERQCGFSAGDDYGSASAAFNPLDTFQHDPTYANVTLGSDRFRLGPIQANVVKQLHLAAETDKPWVHQSVLTDNARAESRRIVDLFTSKDKLNALIERDGQGNCRLNLPRRTSKALCRSAYSVRLSMAPNRWVGRPSHPSHPATHL